MIETSGLFPNAPCSAFLEADVRNQVRNHGIVVWLDLDGHYSSFVEALMQARAREALPYQVLAFRGSYLELMLALAEVAEGVDKPRLLLHLPGFTEETVRHTPLLELYEPGVRYRKALDTLLTEAAAGRVRPEQLAAFKARPNVTLAAADQWLAELLADSDAGLTAHLRHLKPTTVLDMLLTGELLSDGPALPEQLPIVWERFAVWLGLPASWRELSLPVSPSGARDVAFAAASWALAVEYVDDLKRPPVNAQLLVARALPRAVIDACRALAAHLRERHNPFYTSTADATEVLLADEVEAARAEDLGKIDTFRFEEDKVFKAALHLLEKEQYDQTLEWAAHRLESKSAASSPWLLAEPNRIPAWQLVRDAARLGQAILRAGARIDGSSVAGSSHPENALDGTVQAYVTRGAAVDQAHRQLEQRRASQLYSQLPEFETLRARLDGVRQRWRSWADGWAREFSQVCRTHGFLPSGTLQQRRIFEEVVKPLTQEPGVTAYFVIDALRFEMGEELSRQLDQSPGTSQRLRAGLAELPTVTEVGMNVLAPVEKGGRLALAMDAEQSMVQGFHTGEFRVCDPESRRRVMHARVGGTTCPWLSLEEVVSRDVSALKRAVAQAKLLVVHSQEIDQAGENGMGPAVFDLALQKIRAAWRLLRDAGIRRFVFTSDHGFLLFDEGSGGAQPHGRRVDPKRRHVFSPVAADHAGEVRVPLAALGYEGVTAQLMFPESTVVFDTGKRSAGFVHGGNSLQERVIPILTVLHRTAAGSTGQQYALSALSKEGVAGMHCLEIVVETLAQRELDFTAAREVELALRVAEPVPSAPDGIGVELCQARGKARLERGLIVATVRERFELFFRLSGATDARVQLELYLPSAVSGGATFIPDTRFEVTATRSVPSGPGLPRPGGGGRSGTGASSWLEQLSDPGIRQFFEHLAAHGTVTEGEANAMLGGPRGLRRFALQFEEYARKAPFGVRIEVVAGVKRYVREGNG